MSGRHLIHRCNTQRYTASSQGYGQKRTPAANLTDVHFRLRAKQQRAFNSLTGEWLVSTRYTAQFLRDADVIAGDRITAVTDEYGNSIAGTFEIEGIIDRRAATLRLKTAELNKVA